MKKIIALLLLSILVFSSCEKVVTVPLETAAPRLVIDASIACVKGVPMSTQTIKLSTTAPYYASEVPAVSGANVSISMANGTVFEFGEVNQTGVYQCTNFEATINTEYTLLVNYSGQTYTATESLQAVPVIDKIEQEEQPKIGGGGFTIDIKTFFTDPADSNDFYLVRVNTNRTAIPEYSVTDDAFFQGNQVFDFYRNEDLVPGDVVTIRLGRISQRYHNYMKIITSFSGNNGGGPFSSPPATVRGNIVNTTNPDLFVLGYFSLSEVVSQTYTLE
jgi:hypothetical protein